MIRAYKRGVDKRQISRDVGLSYTGTCRVIERYEAGGMAALKPRKRGHRQGSQRVLSTEQETAIQKLICDKRPEQLKMEFALWSRLAVRQLIRDEYGIDMPVHTVGN